MGCNHKTFVEFYRKIFSRHLSPPLCPSQRWMALPFRSLSGKARVFAGNVNACVSAGAECLGPSVINPTSGLTRRKQTSGCKTMQQPGGKRYTYTYGTDGPSRVYVMLSLYTSLPIKANSTVRFITSHSQRFHTVLFRINTL